jgi:colanic acid biosynthesis glycosyl transferase WcaI
MVPAECSKLAMRILIVGLNYAPDCIGIAPYTQGLAENLTRYGHSVKVIAGKPYYPDWKVPKNYRGFWSSSIEDGIEVVRCPIYVPAEPNGIRRIVHLISYSLASLFPSLAAAIFFKPTCVISIAPSLLSAPIALLAAKFGRAHSWLHVQDFEVGAAFATGLVDSNSMVAKLAVAFEQSIIRRFKMVSSISPEMCQRLRGYGLPAQKIFELRNWSNLEDITPIDGESPYRREWGISTKHVALYSGNIANKQGIEIIVAAAQHLRDRKDLTFVVCGEGPNRASLEIEAKGLKNIVFRDLQPRERLRDLLGLATVHLLPQRADAADLVLPSKLTNMLASGRPVVVTAADGSGLAREVEGCGIATPPNDYIAFANAIEVVIDQEELQREMSLNARKQAINVWNRDAILANFNKFLMTQCSEATAS